MSPVVAALRVAAPGVLVASAAPLIDPLLAIPMVPMALLAAILCAGATGMTRFAQDREMSVATMAMFLSLALRLGGVSAAVLFYLLPQPASAGRTAAVATLIGCLAVGLVIEMIDRLTPVSQETARA